MIRLYADMLIWKVKILIRTILSPYHRISNRAVTLVELTINIAIISIMFMAVTVVFTKMLQLWRLNQAKVEVQRNARTVSELINRNLRQGQASTVVLDRYNTSQPPYSRISFTKKGETGSRIFYQLGQKLYEVHTATRMVCENLKAINFAYPDTDDSSIISVSVTFEKATYSGQTKALQLSVEKVRIMN